MNGKIKILVTGRNYGFICDDAHNEYFFHKDDYEGNWDELVAMNKLPGKIPVEFDKNASKCDLRAEHVKLAVAVV